MIVRDKGLASDFLLSIHTQLRAIAKTMPKVELNHNTTTTTTTTTTCNRNTHMLTFAVHQSRPVELFAHSL